MLYTPIWAAFLFCHLCIQILWTATSRGRNYEAFLKTWMHLRSIPIVAFEAAGFVQILFSQYLAFSLRPVPLATQILGLGIAITGVVLASWAKVVMGTSWGRPAQHDRQKQTRLVTVGPFSFSRNPIYIGLFLFFVGQQISLMSYGILLAIPFWIAVRNAVTAEEKLLLKYFSREYAAYAKHVPRFL